MHPNRDRLRSHNTEQGMEAMHKALQIDSGAEMLNDVAYEMAEADANPADGGQSVSTGTHWAGSTSRWGISSERRAI